MHFYIEAFTISGTQILGNLEGQASIRDVKQPTRTERWKHLFSSNRPNWARMHHWHLVNERNQLLATCTNPHCLGKETLSSPTNGDLT